MARDLLLTGTRVLTLSGPGARRSLSRARRTALHPTRPSPEPRAFTRRGYHSSSSEESAGIAPLCVESGTWVPGTNALSTTIGLRYGWTFPPAPETIAPTPIPYYWDIDGKQGRGHHLSGNGVEIWENGRYFT